MDSIVRVIAIYIFLLIVFRIAGRRTLAEMTSFDLIVLLIISEQTQQAMVGHDHSLINAMLMIITLVGTDIGFSLLKQRSSTIEKLLDGVPTILLEDGRPLKDRMAKARVDEFDILAAARQLQGLERLDQVKYAVLERNGDISIIPKEQSK